jgi:hypothetical protein
MGPIYPSYPSQPYAGGKLPSMVEVGPPDLRYSSGTAPYYQAGIDAMYGRSLAGSEHQVQDENANAEAAWATNELAAYAELDDVQGSGIFDPPGTEKNIHPDAGVFAERFSLPGYHARERPFAMSEVRDVATGRPIRAVPSGAVALDDAAQIAFLERGLYAPPEPVMRAASMGPVRRVSIANWMQNPQPITATSGLGLDTSATGKNLLLAAAVGVAIGGIAGYLARKKRSAG